MTRKPVTRFDLLRHKVKLSTAFIVSADFSIYVRAFRVSKGPLDARCVLRELNKSDNITEKVFSSVFQTQPGAQRLSVSLLTDCDLLN